MPSSVIASIQVASRMNQRASPRVLTKIRGGLRPPPWHQPAEPREPAEQASAPNDTLGGGFEVPMMCGVLIASDSKSSARDQS